MTSSGRYILTLAVPFLLLLFFPSEIYATPLCDCARSQGALSCEADEYCSPEDCVSSSGLSELMGVCRPISDGDNGGDNNGSEGGAALSCNCSTDSDCGSGKICNNNATCDLTYAHGSAYTGLCEAAPRDDGGSGDGGSSLTDVPGCIDTPIGCIPTDTGELVGWILGRAIVVAGLVAVVLFIIGGYTIATAGGNPDQITEGKSVITAAISGLLFILLATLLLHIIGIDILGLENWLY
jgi:hypothetical protein